MNEEVKQLHSLVDILIHWSQLKAPANKAVTVEQYARTHTNSVQRLAQLLYDLSRFSSKARRHQLRALATAWPNYAELHTHFTERFGQIRVEIFSTFITCLASPDDQDRRVALLNVANQELACPITLNQLSDHQGSIARACGELLLSPLHPIPSESSDVLTLKDTLRAFPNGVGIPLPVFIRSQIPFALRLELAMGVVALIADLHRQREYPTNITPSKLWINADFEFEINASPIQELSAYSPPEVNSEEPARSEGNVWSIATIIFEMITREHLFKAKTKEGLERLIKTSKLSVEHQLIPAEIQALLERALSRKEDRRFYSAVELRSVFLNAYRRWRAYLRHLDRHQIWVKVTEDQRFLTQLEGVREFSRERRLKALSKALPYLDYLEQEPLEALLGMVLEGGLSVEAAMAQVQEKSREIEEQEAALADAEDARRSDTQEEFLAHLTPVFTNFDVLVEASEQRADSQHMERKAKRRGHWRKLQEQSQEKQSKALFTLTILLSIVLLVAGGIYYLISLPQKLRSDHYEKVKSTVVKSSDAMVIQPLKFLAPMMEKELDLVDPTSDPVSAKIAEDQRTEHIETIKFKWRKVNGPHYEYLLSQTEVTTAQYQACVEAGACPEIRTPDRDHPDFQLCNGHRTDVPNEPMNCVTWSEAMAFAKWVGGSLPTIAEWRWAALSEGVSKTYPWAYREQNHPWVSQLISLSEADCSRVIMYGVPTQGQVAKAGCGRGATTPVCSRLAGASAQGLCDLLGNVGEWVLDRKEVNFESLTARDQAKACLNDEQLQRVYRAQGFTPVDSDQTADTPEQGGAMAGGAESGGSNDADEKMAGGHIATSNASDTSDTAVPTVEQLNEELIDLPSCVHVGGDYASKRVSVDSQSRVTWAFKSAKVGFRVWRKAQ